MRPMKKKLSNVGRLPEDDIEFVEVLWEVGKNLEDKVKEENGSHRKSPEPTNPKRTPGSKEVKDHNSSHRVNKKTRKKSDKGDRGDKGSTRRRSNATRRRMTQPRGSTPSWLKNVSRITIASHVGNQTIAGSNARGQLLRHPLVRWPATSAVSLTLQLRRKREKNPSIMPSMPRFRHGGSEEKNLLSHADTRDVSRHGRRSCLRSTLKRRVIK